MDALGLGELALALHRVHRHAHQLRTHAPQPLVVVAEVAVLSVQPSVKALGRRRAPRRPVARRARQGRPWQSVALKSGAMSPTWSMRPQLCHDLRPGVTARSLLHRTGSISSGPRAPLPALGVRGLGSALPPRLHAPGRRPRREPRGAHHRAGSHRGGGGLRGAPRRARAAGVQRQGAQLGQAAAGALLETAELWAGRRCPPSAWCGARSRSSRPRGSSPQPAHALGSAGGAAVARLAVDGVRCAWREASELHTGRAVLLPAQAVHCPPPARPRWAR